MAIVCAGYESSFRSVTLVKSLLYHRRHAITMHFVVDDVAAQILPTLFDTWQLPSGFFISRSCGFMHLKILESLRHLKFSNSKITSDVLISKSSSCSIRYEYLNFQ